MWDIDAIYETQTERIHDEIHRPQLLDCAWCDKTFKDTYRLESEYFPSKDFCCDECLEEYEANHEVDDE